MLTFYTYERPGVFRPDDPEVLDCLEDNGLPRDPELVEWVEYWSEAGSDGWGTVWEVEVRLKKEAQR